MIMPHLVKPALRLAFVVTLVVAACDPGVTDPSLETEQTERAQGQPLLAAPVAEADPAAAAVLDPLVAPDPAVAPEPAAPAVAELEAGDGWRRVKVTGEAADDETGAVKSLDDEYWVMNGRAAIASSSMPAKAREKLAESAGRQPQTDDGDDEIIIVPNTLVAQMAADQDVLFYGWCDDEEKVYSKTYSFDKSYSYHKGDETGSFTGAADFQARLKGSVTATVKYKVVRDWYTACIPYAVIRRVTVDGNADVNSTANVDASFQKAWAWQKEIAAPKLGTVTLPVVPIPLTFKAPITVGIDAAAKADLHAAASYQAHGMFNVICNSSGCSGSKSATHSFTPGGSPSLSANGLVTVKPWAEGALRAYVLSEWVASAQVGVRAGLPTQLWAYAGNTCGDANNDGVNEWVSGATLDMSVSIDVVAKAKFLGDDKGPWIWNVWNKHVAFWPIANGGALDPIFYNGPLDGSTAVTMRGKMRPCWPYNDVVSYRVLWNDGGQSNFSSHPDTLFSQGHSFGSYGWRTVRLQALSDAKGRSIGGATDDSFRLMPVVATFPVVKVAAATF